MKKIIQYFTLLIAITFGIGISIVFANELPQNIFQEDPAYAELQLCLQDPPEGMSWICYEGLMKNVESINTDEEMDFFLQNVCGGSFEYNRVCMIAFGEKVAALPEASTHCDKLEEGERADLCRIYTIFYREDFSDSDLEEIAEICSNTEKLSDETMEVCYELFVSKCGTKNDTSPSICSEKMPIFYWHPYTAIMYSYTDSSGTNFGYGIAEPEIELCIERRANQCIRELFLTMDDENEMKSVCELAKGTVVEEICNSSMDSRLEEIQAEEEEKALLEAREKNVDECYEKMLLKYKDYSNNQELEDYMEESFKYKCLSYSFLVEHVASELDQIDELQIEALHNSWIHYMFLEEIYSSELSNFLSKIIAEDTQEGLKALKDEIEKYKASLKEAQGEVDAVSQQISEADVIAVAISEDCDEFIEQTDYYIDFINRSLYAKFGECPDNICELIEAEKAFEEEKLKPIFDDVDRFSRWATPIRYLKKTNVISGYPDETFKPDYAINRAELLKIAIESQFNESEIEACMSENFNPDWSYMFFTDVPIKEWYAKYVCMGKIHGIIKGYPDGTFQPQRAVNRAESIKIVMEALNFNVDDVEFSVKPYGDTLINEWFTPYIYQGKQMGIFSNTSYKFEPGEEINRGEISEILYRLLAISKLKEEKYSNELDIRMFQLSEQ